MKNIYFYIPGAESLNTLYFLSERYGAYLTVITSSISVVEVCRMMSINYIMPNFNSLPRKYEQMMTLCFLKRILYFNLIKKIISKLNELLDMTVKLIQARRMVKSIEPGSTLYYSTFFFDVPGILFLGAAIQSKKLSIKLMWPSSIRFNKIIKPSCFTLASYLNLLTSDLFVFHMHPSGGRIIGVNPNYLLVKKVFFFHEKELMKGIPSKKYIEKAISLINIKPTAKPRVLFLGEYSVENGIVAYGDVYLKILNLLGNLEEIDTYYKPHPLYHSISHPSLANLQIIDTQIPVEFLDDGSWSFIVALYTASLMTSKVSKCICLLALEEIESKIFDQDKLLKLTEISVNQMHYPKNLSAFESLLKKSVVS